MKKLTINSVALGSLKARKKQYMLMITGIVLAMIFSSGIVFFASSVATSLKELSYSNYGRQSVILFGVKDKTQVENLTENKYASDFGYAQILGYCYTEGKETKGFSVAKFDENTLSISNHQTVKGRMPEKEGEIAIEADALIRLGIKAETGDNISFKFKVQNGDVRFDKEIEKNYTLVGILKDKRSNIQRYNSDTDSLILPAAIVSNAENPDPGCLVNEACYLCFDSKDWNILYPDDGKEWYDRRYTEYTDPSHFTSSSSKIESKGMLAGVLAAVLATASCIGIINAFNSNLQERKKQIGLYRAVGATRKQIINILGREVAVITIIASPVSVILSYLITKLIISFMGDGLIFAPKLYILFIGAALSIVFVLIAAMIPIVSASKISPMQSIRNIDSIRKIRNSKVKTQSKFNVPALLAKREISFGKGKTVAISIILIVAFLLNCFGISFLDKSFKAVTFDGSDYTLYKEFTGYMSLYANYANSEGLYGIPQTAVNDILMNPYVKNISVSQQVNATIIPEKDYKILEYYEYETKSYFVDSFDKELTKDNYRDFINEQEVLLRRTETQNGIAYSSFDDREIAEVQEKFGYNDNCYNLKLISGPAMSLEEMKNYVYEGKINIDKINSGEEVILAVPKKSALAVNTKKMNFDGESKIYTDFTMIQDYDKNKVQKFGEKYKILEETENDIHAGDTLDLSMIFDRYTGPEGLSIYDDFFSSEARQIKKEVKVGAIIDLNTLFFNNYFYQPTLITSNEAFSSLCIPESISTALINLNSECTEDINESVCASLDSVTSGESYSYNSLFSSKQTALEEKRAIIVGFASIIILFFTAGTGLINNSITSKIREGKKRIGTLRAVGASQSDIIKSYILQLSGLFGTGYALGFVLYTIMFIGIKIYYNALGEEMMISYLVWPAILIGIAMFIVCSINLWAQIRKLTKYSIVENIREL